MPGLKPGTPARMERTLTTMLQPHAIVEGVIYHADRSITTTLGRLGQFQSCRDSNPRRQHEWNER